MSPRWTLVHPERKSRWLDSNQRPSAPKADGFATTLHLDPNPPAIAPPGAVGRSTPGGYDSGSVSVAGIEPAASTFAGWWALQLPLTLNSAAMQVSEASDTNAGFEPARTVLQTVALPMSLFVSFRVGHGRQSTRRESNPHVVHGKDAGCRYITGACICRSGPRGGRTLMPSLRDSFVTDYEHGPIHLDSAGHPGIEPGRREIWSFADVPSTSALVQ